MKITDDPPLYSPALDDSSTAGSSYAVAPALGKRVNHLYITEANFPVGGTWTVDSSFRIPPSLLPPNSWNGDTLDNLHLLSKNGSVTATIAVVGEPDSERARALLHTESHNGKVQVDIVSRRAKRFRLFAKSRNGPVTVSIPRNFFGPVSFATRNGKVLFSDDVQNSMMLFGRSAQVGKGFIGDFSCSGYGDETEGVGKNAKVKWDGDELDLASDNSSIRVSFADE